MNQESMRASSELLDTLSQLLDESTPQELLPMIAKVACQVLNADAAVLEIPAELADEPFRFAYPSAVAISSSAVRRAREEKKAVLWNQADGNIADISKSIVKNKLTSIMVAPFQTLSTNIVSGFLYLQREARRDPFNDDEKKLFDKFVAVSEKIAFSAYNRQNDKESLDALRGVTRKGSIVYASQAMADVISRAEKFVALPAPVIIRGETGTGKEVLARWLHSQSPRNDKPFVAINCGAIPENLIESILFGHVKGSFTGAIDTRKGVFEEAEGGTLFLDEIGELPLNMQVKLLRVLQEHHITRVGDNREIPVNVRIISATHVNLEEAMKEHRFREDLYYRLNVIPIQILPLRSRKEDIEDLANYFIRQYAPQGESFILSPEALKKLQAHQWPGNIRELENVIQRALCFANPGFLKPEDLQIDEGLYQEKAPSGIAYCNSYDEFKEYLLEQERQFLTDSIAKNGGSVSLTAERLGMLRTALYNRLSRLGVKVRG